MPEVLINPTGRLFCNIFFNISTVQEVVNFAGIHLLY